MHKQKPYQSLFFQIFISVSPDPVRQNRHQLGSEVQLRGLLASGHVLVELVDRSEEGQATGSEVRYVCGPAVHGIEDVGGIHDGRSSGLALAGEVAHQVL